MDDFPALMNLAHSELYRTNAFRLACLPVDAGGREIKRQLDRLKIMEKLGAGAGRLQGPLSLDVPADGEMIRAAMERLHEPERRMLEEFFWFWPATRGESQADPAVQALSRGDIEAARSVWLEWSRSADRNAIACHNLAVLAHVRALDLEHAGADDRPLTMMQACTRDSCWLEAYGHWREVLRDESFWDSLAGHYRSLNEPQVGPEMARRLRAALPAALVRINA